jgi:glycosyltransferase involved in cell wall biosynthesis
VEALFWKIFIWSVDAWISLTRTGLSAAKERFPDLATKKHFVVPHGHYRDVYPRAEDQRQSRELLEVPAAARVILFFGSIRNYKNVLQLVRSFLTLEYPEAFLLIAGKPSAYIESRLRHLAECDRRIRLHLGVIPHNSVAHFFAAADLVILPFQEILNSGTALLSLSLNRPIVVPDMGAMSELKEQVGPGWVRTYHGEFSQEQLIQALDWLRLSSRPVVASLDRYSWDVVADGTLHAYTELLR